MKYTVSANGTTFGTYEADNEQDARDAGARDAGYQREAHMVEMLEQPSDLQAKKYEPEVRIVADEENSAEAFWAYVNASEDAPEELVGLSGEITVSSERAKEIEAWCRNAPGFADCPSHAPTALTFVEE